MFEKETLCLNLQSEPTTVACLSMTAICNLFKLIAMCMRSISIVTELEVILHLLEECDIHDEQLVDAWLTKQARTDCTILRMTDDLDSVMDILSTGSCCRLSHSRGC